MSYWFRGHQLVISLPIYKLVVDCKASNQLPNKGCSGQFLLQFDDRLQWVFNFQDWYTNLESYQVLMHLIISQMLLRLLIHSFLWVFIVVLLLRVIIRWFLQEFVRFPGIRRVFSFIYQYLYNLWSYNGLEFWDYMRFFSVWANIFKEFITPLRVDYYLVVSQEAFYHRLMVLL